MRKQAVVIASVLLTACSDNAVKNAVKERLVDPESARFGEISYSAGGSMACAEVNSKNRMGGYNGKTQAYLEKMDGEWSYVSDFPETHEACVRSINESEKSSRTAAAIPDNSTPPPDFPSPMPGYGPGVVSITAKEPVWVMITDGPKTLFSGELDAGQQYKVPSTASAPQLKAGSAEAIRITVGNRVIPPLSKPGGVVSGVSLKQSDLLR